MMLLKLTKYEDETLLDEAEYRGITFLNELVGEPRACDRIVHPDAWHLVFDVWILNFVVECTKEYANENVTN